MSPEQSAAIAIFVMAYGPDALYAQEGWRVNDAVADIRDNPTVRYRTYLAAAQRVHPFYGGRQDAFRALKHAKAVLDHQEAMKRPVMGKVSTLSPMLTA